MTKTYARVRSCDCFSSGTLASPWKRPRLVFLATDEQRCPSEMVDQYAVHKQLRSHNGIEHEQSPDGHD